MCAYFDDEPTPLTFSPFQKQKTIMISVLGHNPPHMYPLDTYPKDIYIR